MRVCVFGPSAFVTFIHTTIYPSHPTGELKYLGIEPALYVTGNRSEYTQQYLENANKSL